MRNVVDNMPFIFLICPWQIVTNFSPFSSYEEVM